MRSVAPVVLTHLHVNPEQSLHPCGNKRMQIARITRRDISDAVLVGGIDWSGRLDEPAFLGRMFDLASLPSTDRRFPDASGDI